MDIPTQGTRSDAVISAYCPAYTAAVEVIGRRWTGAIVRALLSGASRFSEITAAVPGLSDRLLSERLKELECEGIVQRDVTPSTPVRVDYRLTEKGEALGEVVRAIGDWAGRWAAVDAAFPDQAPSENNVSSSVSKHEK